MGKSICVVAGAGTGKTFLLSKRYLALLMHLQEQKSTATVSKILTLTFTEKAANEMHERIESDIRKLVASATSEKERRFWTDILDEFFHSPITTFHGFCASVLREFALDADLEPNFDILSEMEKQILTTKLIHNVLTRPPESLYQDCVLLFNDVTSPEKIIAELLMKYPEYQHRFPKTDKEMNACIQEWRSLMISALQERKITFFSDSVVSAISDLINLAEHYGNGDDPGAMYLCQVLPVLRQLKIDVDVDTFCATIAALRRANGNITGARLGNKITYGTDINRLRKSFRQLRSAVDAIPKEWNYIPDPKDPFSCKSVRVIAALGRVTSEVNRLYQQEKQKKGALDFEDLIRMTTEVIRIPSILQELQRRFAYILVDEVQDTDPSQFAIIWKIIGTLTPSVDAAFIVGDPKQSVYAFRNADICEMNSMQEKIITECETHPVVLDVNFRSTKEILGVVNTIFSRLFTETAEAWDVPYDPISVSHIREEDTGTVQILKTIPNGFTPNMLLEARIIVARIQELIASDIMIRDEYGMRPARFGDIAILLETRKNQAMIEHALREADVPYNIYKSRGFYYSQEIIDITQLLSVVAGLGDDIALYGVLRSPYFSISDTELYIVGEGSYYNRINQYAVNNPNSRIALALAQLQKWRNYAGTKPLPELLRRILYEAGMYAVYGGIQNGKYALANLEKLIGLARSQVRKCAMSLPEFVRMLATGTEQKIKEEIAQISPSEREGVWIMTVHASKGLEFPIVILANLDNSKSSPGTDLVLDRELGIGLSIQMHNTGDRVTDTFVKMFTREIREKKEIAEKKRLFYVAMTRARDHLILSYVENETFPPKNSRAAWLIRYLLPKKNQSSSFTFTTDDGFPVEISVIEYVSDRDLMTVVSSSFPTDFQYILEKIGKNKNITRYQTNATSRTHSNQNASCSVSVPSTYEIALHGVFQGLNVSMLCRKYRLSDESRISLIRAYDAFFNSSLMQNVAERFCELPFSIDIDGRRFTGTIDQLVRYTDGNWCIINYKHDSMMTTREREQKDCQYQASIYVAAIRQLFSVEASVCIYFVQNGKIMEIPPDKVEMPDPFDNQRDVL
jgi:ATP-dependent helicase/nuclease subunit A